jgi:hypothetical protein
MTACTIALLSRNSLRWLNSLLADSGPYVAGARYAVIRRPGFPPARKLAGIPDALKGSESYLTLVGHALNLSES